ncbi:MULTISPECIES: hypothetical protein [unclassified Mesorhizobium]|uniref:hypothetical protein n=1 Tax=unclassified Mesorhizobium TaxID=325217 RepID=UPI00112A141D|nr:MULTISPECIES: hypothetical protein [unclassified Mesorhizobium]TPN50876.1 hypothetical protein FJ976_14720 [Mesorhizobium sp. B1-1-9]TPN53090.1 hypothetical protein FJ978_09855 [Mesorhizobium sp. B1-1-7]
MMKNIILMASLFANASVLYVLFNPAGSPAPKMTCDQSRSETLSKEATSTFAHDNGGAFFKVHGYLKSSDFELRNILTEGNSTTFIYTASLYPSTCGSLLSGVDGTIVRVKTDLANEPNVVAVY